VSEQDVRLVFLGDHADAIRSLDTVTTGTKKLAAAERDHARAQQEVATSTRRMSSETKVLERDLSASARGAIVGSGAFRGLGRSIAFASGTFLGGFGLTLALRTAVDEMQNAARVGAQTSQVIKTTGGAAGVTARQVDVLAKAVMEKAGIDDEAVKSAENLLLTFTEVRNEVGKGNNIFTQATKATVDMAAALANARGGSPDLAGAAIQVGRALNDPIQGLTALRRVGVSFTSAQVEQIKALEQSGQIMGAQKLILQELQREFGGTAAKVNAASGNLGTLREDLKNIAGDYAKVLAPDIREAAKAADEWAHRIETDADARKKFKQDVDSIVGAIKDLITFAHQVTDAVGGVKNAFELLIGVKLLSWINGLGLANLIGSAGAAEAGAGEGLLGAAGAAGLLRSRLLALSKIGVIPIEIELLEKTGIGKGDVGSLGALLQILQGHATKANILNFLLGIQPKKQTPGVPPPGTGVLPPPTLPAGAAGTSGIHGKGVQIPTSFTATHQTAGLAGFPAVDIMSKPGTPIKAPEDGLITRISGHEPSEAPPNGQGGPWGLSIYFVGTKTGNTYFLTHLMKVGELGAYKKGDIIGIIGDYPGSPADHVHVGLHQGTSSAAYVPSIGINKGDFITGRDAGGGSKGGPPRKPPPRGGGNPNQIPLDLQQALAQAGVTSSKADDRTALQAIIAWIKQRLTAAGIAQTTRIDLLNQEGSFIDQLAGLAPTKKKGPSKASAAALVNIHHTLDAVTKLVDQAGLAKKFDPELEKINKELSGKFVTSATLAKIRNQLGDISKAAAAAIDKAKQQVAARKQAFTDAWTQLSSDAFAAFDKETAAHVSPSRTLLNQIVGQHDQSDIDQAVADARKAVDDALNQQADQPGPTRSLLNQMIGAHDKQGVEQAVADAQKALADALAGQNSQTDSDIVSKIREMVGKAALANAIDKTQASLLGISAQPMDSNSLIAQLQGLLAPGASADPQAIENAQKQLDEAVYQQKLYYLGLQADAEDAKKAQDDQRNQAVAAANKQLTDALYNQQVFYLGQKADAEDAAYAAAREQLRSALELNLAAWEAYYLRVGEKTGKAAGDFATVWASVLAGIPTAFGGTNTGGDDTNTPDVKTIAPGFNIPAGVIGAGFGGAFAGGGEGIVTRPTLFLAGEGVGAEHYKFTPMNGGNGSPGGQPVNVHVHTRDAALSDFIDVRIDNATARISRALGARTSERQRSGRF
jgi:hypothetical protein